jgi:hypothetical protein
LTPGSVRATTPEEGPRIAALLAEAGLHPNMRPADMQWKYWQSRADWPAPRSFVLVRRGEILAHAGVVPGTCAWEGGRARTIHLIDWAARPNAMGAGVSLMKHIGRSVDVLLAIGGSDKALELFGQLAFRPAGVVTAHVRTLHPLRTLRGADGPRWRIVPRFARSALRMAMAPRTGRGNSEAHRLGPDGIGSLTAEFPYPSPDTAILERNESLFRYLLACPIVPIEVYSWERWPLKRGYFVLARAPGQVRLVDCWVSSEEPDDWCALVQCAVEQARRHPEAAELVAWASDPLLCGVLRQCGFHTGAALPIQLLTRKGSSVPPATLRVQMVDNDAAYLCDGGVPTSA